jgi:hypothetical protein
LQYRRTILPKSTNANIDVEARCLIFALAAQPIGFFRVEFAFFYSQAFDPPDKGKLPEQVKIFMRQLLRGL